MGDRKYKLTYFSARAMGEPIRYMFVAAGVEFENDTIEFKDWPEIKPTTPFGMVPVLEFDGHKVGQTVAICRFLATQFDFLPETDIGRLKADAIADTFIDMRAPEIQMFAANSTANKPLLAELAEKFKTEQFPYLMAKLEKFVPESDFVTGSKMTWADIFLASILEFLVDGGKLYGYTVNVDDYPKISAIQKRVFSDAKIAEYRKSRQVGELDL